MPRHAEKITSQLKQGMVVSTVLTIIAALFGLLLIFQIARDQHRHTVLRSQRQEILHTYIEAMLNQETGLRGYLASPQHEPEFLAPYRQGKSQFSDAFIRSENMRRQTGQEGFQTVVRPIQEAARIWQQEAERKMEAIANGGDSSSNDWSGISIPRTSRFDAFRKAYENAVRLNEAQMEDQSRALARGWLLAGAFAIVVMALGIAAGVYVGQRAAGEIGTQAERLVEQAKRLKAHQTELHSQNERLQEQQMELQTLNRELALIGEITAIAGSELRTEGALAAFEEPLRRLIPFDRCGLILLEDENATARLSNMIGAEIPDWSNGRRMPVGDTLLSLVLENGRPVVLTDIEEAGLDNLQAAAYAAAGIRAYVMVPMIAGGKMIGSLNFSSQSRAAYHKHYVELMKQVAGRIAGVLENTRLFAAERTKAELLALSVQETHHRVKNNLQAVSSLLDYQLLEAGETVSAEVLRRTITQIKAIALVHDLLSRDTDEEVVDVKRVVEKLIPLVTTSYEDASVETQLTPILLPMRRVTSLALTINELVLNALKHRGDKPCHIRVEASVDPESGLAFLVVQDDGPGFPNGFDPDRDSNIGIELVTTLVRSDLGGRISFTNAPGARVEITFPTNVGSHRNSAVVSASMNTSVGTQSATAS